MALPTFSQIVTQMVNFITGKRPSLNTNPGTVTNDVIISTVANQLSAQDGTSQSVYSNIAYTQELQSFATDAVLLVPSDLDQIATNYGMTRLPGSASTGFITFRIRNYTTSSPIINIPAGTTISTLATSQAPAVSFATTAGFTFTPSLAPSYFNPVSGFYENPSNSIPIICQTIGTAGNVSSNTITSLVSSVAGIDAVTNTTATTGGTNIESNIAFAARIQIKLEGNNVGTPNGILSLVETNPNVQQAIVVGPNDSDMLRDQFGGSVDVYIRGQILTTTTDVLLYTTAGSQSFILNNQPVLSVGSVTGIRNGVPDTFTLGVDYNFIKNPNLLFGGSSLAGSYIQFLGSTSINITNVNIDGVTLSLTSATGISINDLITQGVTSSRVTGITNPTTITVASNVGFVNGAATFSGLPDNNTNITITYTYDSLISTLQALLDSNSNHIEASDILVREAAEALIGVTASILILPGNVSGTVITAVQTNLTTYINSLLLGAVIPLSEIVDVIQSTPGVEQVDISTLIISSTVGIVVINVPPGQAINLSKTTYPVSGNFVITIGA